MSDLLVPMVKSSVAVVVATEVAKEVTEADSVADAADSVVEKEEKILVAVVAIEAEIIQDLLMATILREVEREEVVSDLPEVATPLPKSDNICG